MEQERLYEEIDNRPIWVGTVLEFEQTAYDPITFEFGGRYELKIDVARIKPITECGDPVGADYTQSYITLLREKVAPGMRLAFVRSRDRDGTLDSYSGFFRHLLANGEPDLARHSINEEMVTAGLAQPDPEVAVEPKSYQDSVDEVRNDQRQELSALDFAYWDRFVTAYRTAFVDRRGLAVPLMEVGDADRDTPDRMILQ